MDSTEYLLSLEQIFVSSGLDKLEKLHLVSPIMDFKYYCYSKTMSNDFAVTFFRNKMKFGPSKTKKSSAVFLHLWMFMYLNFGHCVGFGRT